MSVRPRSLGSQPDDPPPTHSKPSSIFSQLPTCSFMGQPSSVILRLAAEARIWIQAEERGLAAESGCGAGKCSVRLQPQFGTSLKPRPLRIIGTHLSDRAALVFACFADETWKMYDFLRPGVSIANADVRTAFASSLLCNSSGIAYSEGFFSSTFVPDSSNSMAS